MDVLTVITENFPDIPYVLGTPDEGGSEELDLVLNSEAVDVDNIFLSEGGEVYFDSWEIHVLPFAEQVVILTLHNDFLFMNRLDPKD